MLHLHPLYFFRIRGKKYKGFLSYLYNAGLIYYCEMTVICVNNDNEFPEKKEKRNLRTFVKVEYGPSADLTCCSTWRRTPRSMYYVIYNIKIIKSEGTSHFDTMDHKIYLCLSKVLLNIAYYFARGVNDMT